MARGQSVRGTPVRHVSSAGTRNQGMGHGTPKGMDGTVHKDYASDNRGYAQNPRGGTPYHSQDGNDAQARRVVEHSTNAESSDHGNQNNPISNGKGVILDGANRYEHGYEPADRRTLDSPVPEHAPVFDTGFIQREDAAHAGRGNEGTARDNILEIGGVLSRGMEGTSKASDRDEGELTHDDRLRGRQGESRTHEKE